MNIISTQKFLFPQLVGLFGFKNALLIILGLKLRNINKESKDKLIHILSFDATKEIRLKKIRLIENIPPKFSNFIVDSMKFDHFNFKDFENFVNSKLTNNKFITKAH